MMSLLHEQYLVNPGCNRPMNLTKIIIVSSFRKRVTKTSEDAPAVQVAGHIQDYTYLLTPSPNIKALTTTFQSCKMGHK